MGFFLAYEQETPAIFGIGVINAHFANAAIPHR